MEPNQTISTDQRPGSDIVFRDKSSKGKGMIIGMVVLALLAIGGIGFGVWEMMDGNHKMVSLDEQIDMLTQQNSELQKQIVDLEEAQKQNDDKENTVFEPVSMVSSDQKIYAINNEDKVVAVLEVPVVVKNIIGCSAAISDNESSKILTCAGTSTTDEEFGFSYDTTNGAFKSSFDE